MIAADKRKAVFLLHQEGMEAREIARRLALSRNAVRTIIRQQGAATTRVRADKQRLDEALLRRLYQECQGRMARVHEKLVEEEGLAVSYPTLTRMLRELGISKAQKARCDRVPDEPGLEMQHDTSVYQVPLAGRAVKLIASLLYLRYCKRRYLKFYRAFDRFKMKCFLHEALSFWGYAAHHCIIDNTNLARLRGSGANALIVPEMEAFAKERGFVFRCHEIGHCNRKAGEERSFWTVETNFLPGRTFASLEELNQQALEWATVRMDNKPQGRAGLIPAKAFEITGCRERAVNRSRSWSTVSGSKSFRPANAWSSTPCRPRGSEISSSAPRDNRRPRTTHTIANIPPKRRRNTCAHWLRRSVPTWILLCRPRASNVTS